MEINFTCQKPEVLLEFRGGMGAHRGSQPTRHGMEREGRPMGEE